MINVNFDIIDKVLLIAKPDMVQRFELQEYGLTTMLPSFAGKFKSFYLRFHFFLITL